MWRKIKRLIPKRVHQLLNDFVAAESRVPRSVNIHYLYWFLVVGAASGLIVVAVLMIERVPIAKASHLGPVQLGHQNLADNNTAIRPTTPGGLGGLTVVGRNSIGLLAMGSGGPGQVGVLAYGLDDSGVRAFALGANAGHGVVGTTLNSSGIGVFGDNTVDGDGVFGRSGGGVGVRGKSSWRGVHGEGVEGAGVQGESIGIWGVLGSSQNNVGVFAEGSKGGGLYATSSTGMGVLSVSSQNHGVVGRSFSKRHAAIYGDGILGYAGYFVGNVNVTGTINKSALGFKIDHPLDPANKYLFHSSVESPDMKNVYDGVVVLDAKGEAFVQLPAWFDALNRDFRYQLTAIGASAPNLYIAEKISKNRFKIAGGRPRQEVSWQITGIRRDRYAEKHRIPVEEDKLAEERGKYLHPTEHGQAEAMGIHYEDIQKMQRFQTEIEKQRKDQAERDTKMRKNSEEMERRENEVQKYYEDLAKRESEKQKQLSK